MTEKIKLNAEAIKILAISAVLGIIFIGISGYFANEYVEMTEKQRLDNIRQTVILAKSTVEPILVDFRKNKINRDQALNQVRNLVRRMIYRDHSGNNYIFMSSYNGIMLVQPFEPKREMSDVWNLKDSYGNFIIQELVKTARSNPDGGFVTYYYKTPDSETPQEKISFVIGISELECYIGTGKYMYDIRVEQDNYLTTTILLSLTLLILLAFLGFYSLREITQKNHLLKKENQERRLAEHRLKKNQYNLEKAQEIGRIGSWEYHFKEDILIWTEENYRIFGVPLDVELNFDRFYECIHPEDRELVKNTWHASIEKKEYDCEHRILVNGKVKWVQEKAEFELDDNGECIRALGLTQDITNRKITEEALQKSEEKARVTLEAIADPIVAIDIQKRTTFINPAFTQVFGWEPDEIIGKVIPYIPEEEQATAQANIDLVLNEGSAPDFESKRLTKDGRILDVNIHPALMTNMEGNPSGIVVQISDITERKRIETQLRQAQKMEAVGTLAGGIAHDFNNILLAIMGFTELVQIQVQKGKSVDREINQILDAAERAKGLVQQILTFSRKAISKPQRFDLNKIILNTVPLIERTIPKMISIESHLNAGLKKINADPNQIEQVLLNLAANAKDAMPEGGKLVFETENTVIDQDIKFDDFDMPQGEYVLLSVSDSGVGMAKDVIEHIFDPFFTTKDVGKGTGLGLASIYGIVKSHAGHISCHSEPGQGTVFRIYLPADLSHAEDLEASSPKEAVDKKSYIGKEHILLVDDEALLRQIGEEILTSHGYKVSCAADGETALKLYGEHSKDIDLVILDIGMPGMGGHKCMTELLRINNRARVIIVSGYSQAGQLKETIESGAAQFIGKPYRKTDLLKTVRLVLDGESKNEIQT